MKPIHDEKQRQQALDITKSFIVQAPAGSGKTELLTQRFLALLATVRQPEEIIAITFTKKSSAEMRARIINALTTAMLQPEPTLNHAKLTWQLAKRVLNQSQECKWNLIENPNRLRIQTIDSFNAYITRQLPLLSNFGATPEISDNANKLYEEAVREFLSHLEENVEWSESIAQLLVHLDNDLHKVEDLLITMLAKRDQWLPYITFNAYDTDLRNTLEDGLKSVTRGILTQLTSSFPTTLANELLTMLRFAAHHLLKENPTSPIIHCLDLTRMPGTDADDKHYWLGIAELLLTKDFEWRKSINKNIGFPPASSVSNKEEKAVLTSFKQRLTELIATLSENEALRFAFEQLCLSPDCTYQDYQWETLRELHHVLRIAVAQLKVIFQQYGTIDFIENAQAALSALGTEDAPTDMTLALDYQIKHMLIDEFQDTSQSQFRLIEKLIAGWENNDGRTLFLVGDPMQSIYRFREAEVGLFIRAQKNGLRNVTLTPLTLSVNFRSVPGIVNWVNEHFEKVFPAFEDISMGAVRYSHSIANSSQTENTESNVGLHPIIDSENSQQASAIIQLIQQRKSIHPKEHIAILVRSRSHLSTIIPALKQAKLSYRAIDIDPLDERPVIQDLMTLTRALLHTGDRIAWLALLRAPWCGLSLHDLFKLANNYRHTSLWERLQSTKTLTSLSDDGQKRLARILPILKQSIADRHRYPLRLWVEDCWLSLGGPAAVSQASDLIDADTYFNLLEKLDTGGDLSDLNILQKHVSRLFASPNNQADDTLQIMTIHNSKGLEFDTVILPHLESKSPNDQKQLLLWMEQPQQNDKSMLILAPIHASGQKNNSIYDYVKRQQRIKSDYETSRLLYVAATRAKKQLHLFFSLDENLDESNGLSNPASSSLLEKLWPIIKNQITSIKRPEAQAIPNQAIVDALQSRHIRRLSLAWQHPLTPQAVDDIAYQRKQSGFKLPNSQARHTGTVIHELLQYLGLYGAKWWRDKSYSSKEMLIKSRLVQLGLQLSDISSSLETAMLAVENTLSDTRGQWIIHNHLYAESELKLTTRLGDDIQSIILDRTFVDENNTRWIVDYKTSTPTNEIELETFLDQEAKKYHEQMQHYAAALQLMDKRPTKLALYFPLVPAWKELD